MTEFTIHNSTEFVIPGSSVLVNLPVSVATPEVESSSSYHFSSNKTDAKHVKQIKLTRLTLTAISPSGANFDFLNSVSIYISADGLQETLLASLTDIPEGKTSIDLHPSQQEFQEYIKRDKYKIRIETTTDKINSFDTGVRADMSFWVKAKLL